MSEGQYFFFAIRYMNYFELCARSHKKGQRVTRTNYECRKCFIMTNLTANVVKGIKIQAYSITKLRTLLKTKFV